MSPLATLTAWVFLCFAIFCYGQQVPANSNITDAAGRRQGTWTILFNKAGKETQNRDSLSWYRVIEYKDDLPVGKVTEYFRNGGLLFEGTLKADRQKKIIDHTQPFTYYDIKGNVDYYWTKIQLVNALTANKESAKANDVMDELWVYFETHKDSRDYPEFLGRLVRLKADQHYYTDAQKATAQLKEYYDQRPDADRTLYYKAVSDWVSRYFISNPDMEAGIPAMEGLIEEMRMDEKARPYDFHNALSTLGVIYASLTEYVKAEALFLESVDVASREFGNNSDEYAFAVNSLGILYWDMGIYASAEKYLLETIRIYSALFGETSIEVRNAKHTLAKLYTSQLRIAESHRLFKQLEVIYRDGSGVESLSYGLLLSDFAKMYMESGSYKLCDSLLQIARKACINHGHQEFDSYAVVLNQLGRVKKYTGDFAAAENLFKEASDIKKRRFGVNSMPYAGGLFNLGGLYTLRESNYIEGAELVKEAIRIDLAELEEVMPGLSESEKDRFYQGFLSAFSFYNSIVLTRGPENERLVGDVYNNWLTTKGLLLNASSKWKKRILTSGDKKLFTMYTSWEENLKKLYKLEKEQSPASKGLIDSLQEINNGLEKEMSRRSEMFANVSDKKKYTWMDVKASLKPGEVAIEVMRIRKYGVTTVFTDSSDNTHPRYPVYDLTDTIQYAMLVVTPASSRPELVMLADGNDLEGKYLKYYRTAVTHQINDAESYNHYWLPVAKRLQQLIRKPPKEGLKIYFSPDGVYNQINLNTLMDPASGKYLFEQLRVNLVTSTKDIVVPPRNEQFNSLAYLFGFPDYGADNNKPAVAGQKEKKAGSYTTVNVSRGANVVDLPGTKVEVEAVSALLSAQGWQPVTLTGRKAQEEAIKDCFKPRVLHIATHGYFEPDGSGETNPLLRSGLLLAGSGRTLAGGTKDGSAEDGILTSFEAMNLNLDNTDLVVLSACETGLGEIRNGEGVYGLQRAFRVAGARSLLMSLWKVDDAATQELMTTFYGEWLRSGNKRQAFELAQRTIKTKYKAAYYWGAFVLVGE